MARRHGTGTTWRLALGLGLSALSLSATAQADALQCAALSEPLRQDPVTSGAFTVVGRENLYRFQARPYARLPAGVKLALLAPEGVSMADLHRAAQCNTGGEASPLAVPGANVHVTRSGAHYELHITAATPAQAREIQRRAAELR